MAGSSSISDVEGNDQERKVGSQDEEVRVSQPSRQSLGCADSLSPADPSPHRFGCSWNTFLNSWVVTQLMNWRESLLWWPQPHKLEGNATFQVDERCESNHLWPRLHQRFVDGLISDNEKNALISILSAGKLLHHIRIVVLWLVVCMVCAGGSIYGALTVYYGSYNYEYAWTLSAAYLSGLGECRKVSMTLKKREVRMKSQRQKIYTTIQEMVVEMVTKSYAKKTRLVELYLMQTMKRRKKN
eukprot:gene9603-10614_t